MIVIDSSYALACLMPDERRPNSMEHVLGEPLLAPFIWPVEVANAMRNSVLRKRMTPSTALDLGAALAGFEAAIASPLHDDPTRYFESAASHGLTAYDAIYVDLCLRQGAPLASRDDALLRAAGRAGIRTWS